MAFSFFYKFRTKEKLKIKNSKSYFFYLFFEYTKIIPGVIKELVKSSPDTEINKEMMSTVLGNLNYLYKLITEKSCREKLGIKDKVLEENSYIYGILRVYIADEIVAIQNLSLPFEEKEDNDDPQ